MLDVAAFSCLLHFFFFFFYLCVCVCLYVRLLKFIDFVLVFIRLKKLKK